PEPAAIVREFWHRLDEQAPPAAPRLEVQRIALRDTVIRARLDERTAVKVQITLQLDVKLVERKAVADFAQKDRPPEVAVVGARAPELAHLEAELLRRLLHPSVLLALGVIQHDVTAKLHLRHRVLEARWSCTTVDQHDIEVVVLVALDGRRVF